MHTIQIDRDIYQVPSCWDEFTPAQLEYIARITRGEQPDEQLRILVLLKVMKANVEQHSRLLVPKTYIRIGLEPEQVRFWAFRKKYLLSPEEVLRLADIYCFLTRDYTVSRVFDKKQKIIHPKILENPYPKFRHRFHRFQGPTTALYDLTFEQYMYLQTYLDAFLQDPKQLPQLLATVWHTGKYFRPDRIDHDSDLIDTLPEARRIVMYWHIISSIDHLSEQFPRVFSQGGSGQIAHNVLDSQMRLLDSLASSDITRKDTIRKSPLLDCLYTIDETIREADRREDILKKQ